MNKDVAEVSQAYQIAAAEQGVPEGYKQTEVGVIPLDWNAALLPSFVWYQEGPGLRNWQFTLKGIKVINVTNLQFSGFLDLNKTSRHISFDEFEKMYRHFECDAGDFVMASSGNSYSKSSVVRECDLPLLMNTSVIRFKAKNGFDSLFMQSYLKSDFFKEQIDLMITGGAQPNFGPFHLERIFLPIPSSMEEQTAIANALSDVDALLSELEKLIAKKQAIKTATMQQLLTGRTRLPQFAQHQDGSPKGYKQSELGEIPEDWEVESLGDNCHTFSGGTPSTSNKSYYGGDVKWITSSDLNKGLIFDVKGRITELGLQNSASKMIKPETFLIALYGATAGVCAISKINAAINQAVLAVIPDAHYSKYLFYWFSKNKDKIIETYCQGGQPNLSGNIVRFVKMPMPSLAEQTAIATILSDMDAEIQALEQRLNKTRQIKQGMMQELLTGKTRLLTAELSK